MKHKFFLKAFILSSCLFAITGCSSGSKPALKVAASSVPHAQILEFVQPHLHEKGIELEIIVVDDFNTPNRAVADHEADANFFQHLPFLQSQQADFGYALESFVSVHLEPMGIYSKKNHSLNELKEGAVIALPSDPANQARALALIEQAGLITLLEKGAKTGLLDIASNPLNLRFVEMDSSFLCRALDDVDAAAITTNFALLAGLSPKTDALAIETGKSPYTNLVVIRAGESGRPDLQALKEALKSDTVKEFIEKQFHGAVIPAD